MKTNEELIDYQMCQMCNQRRNCTKDKRDRCTEYEDAIEILKEKDQQFKEYLEKKKAEEQFAFENTRADLLNEIINELFKED